MVSETHWTYDNKSMPLPLANDPIFAALPAIEIERDMVIGIHFANDCTRGEWDTGMQSSFQLMTSSWDINPLINNNNNLSTHDLCELQTCAYYSAILVLLYSGSQQLNARINCNSIVRWRRWRAQETVCNWTVAVATLYVQHERLINHA